MHFRTPEDMLARLDAALKDGDAPDITEALGDIARANSMSAVARKSGVARETLYRALSADGNPEFATVLKVLRALNLRLSATVVPDKSDL